MDYSFEYISPDAPLFIFTPVSERVYISIALALRNQTYVALLRSANPSTSSTHAHTSASQAMSPASSHPSTGRTETCREMGRALGKCLQTFTCSAYTSIGAMTRVLLGVMQTGAWGILDQHDTMHVNVLAAVASMLRMVAHAVRAQRRIVEYGGVEMRLVASSTVFMVFSAQPDRLNTRVHGPDRHMQVTRERAHRRPQAVHPIVPSHDVYKQSNDLRSICRHVACPAPDLLIVAAMLLLANGFKQHTALAHRLICLLNACHNLLPIHLRYDFGLRMVGHVVRAASIILSRSRPGIDGSESTSCPPPSAPQSPTHAYHYHYGASVGRLSSSASSSGIQTPVWHPASPSRQSVSDAGDTGGEATTSVPATTLAAQGAGNTLVNRTASGASGSGATYASSAQPVSPAMRAGTSKAAQNDLPSTSQGELDMTTRTSSLDNQTQSPKPASHTAGSEVDEIRSIMGAVKDVLGAVLDQDGHLQLLTVIETCFGLSWHALPAGMLDSEQASWVYGSSADARRITIEKAVADVGLQVEPLFIDKIGQLQRCMQVHGSIFLTGSSGAGKSEVPNVYLNCECS